MRKIIAILLLSLFVFSLVACSSNLPYSPSTDTLDISIFTLPEGFQLEQESSTSAFIKNNGQIVGGITLTGLQSDCIHEKNHLSVQKYLDYTAPSPLIGEWIIMEGKDFLSISMSITDSEKEIRIETNRRIYVYSGLVYDCWFYRTVSEDIAEQAFDHLFYPKILENPKK